MEMDRISDLPQPILHHILSSLSQNDAVKTCVLSKSWRYLWYGRPNVEFCIDDFKGTAQNIISVLDQTLIRYGNQNLSIQKFILKMPKMIEGVSLNNCEWLKTIKVNNQNCSLKYFEFRSYNSGPYIEIANVSRIETIYFEGCKDWFEHHCNNLFTHLKSLRLSRVYLTTKSVHSFSCNFPCLEELELSDCYGAFDEFQLSSPSIKRLAIDVDEMYDPIKVCIDAPNILEFEYKGWDFPSSISFTTTSNKWKSNIVLTTDLDDRNENNGYDLDYMSKWLHKLDELLKVLSRSETSLHILVYCSFDYNRVYGLVYHYDETKVIVKHLELCLGRRLCSDYSVCLELEEKTIKKWNSQRNIY